MNLSTRRNPVALTRIDVLALIVGTCLLAVFLSPNLFRAKVRRSSVTCVDNLKEIGVAYRLWPGDQGDLFPSQQTVALGGWADYLTNSGQGPRCWTNFALMSNDLGESPKLLICPLDVRQAAPSFQTNMDDRNISYFVGVGANDVFPDSFLGGDRNLGPGLKPDASYGYSPTNGSGNDIIIPLSAPVAWSLKMHSKGKAEGEGNILFGDGSVRTASTAELNTKWLPKALDSGHWPVGHTPSSPSIRLVFP